MKITLRDRYQQKYGIKGSLRGYQLQAAQVGVNNTSVALLMDPRLGKTRVDIAISGYRFLNDHIESWVIVCPSIAKYVWVAELEKVLDIPFVVRVVEGPKEEKQLLVKGFKKTPGVLSILIINHEATWRLKKLLYKLMPDRITVDESHRIKNRSAKQARTIYTLGTRAKFRSILTGTLISVVTDVFSQYKFLSPEIFGIVWKDFLDRYVRTYGFGGYKPKTFKNLDELSAKVNSVAFRLTREQAGGFPTEYYQTVFFELTKPASNHYAEMLEKLKTTVADTEVVAEIILTQTLRLQQITGGFLPTREPEDLSVSTNQPLGKDRIRALDELLDEYPSKEPVVIFVKFLYELQAVQALIKRRGRVFSTIAGGMTGAERDKAKNSFQNGLVDSCVVQIRAGGIAIDLSRANVGIFYSLTHSFIDHEQAKARIIARTGGGVSIIYLVARGTVDEDILTSVRERTDLVTRVLERVSK